MMANKKNRDYSVVYIVSKIVLTFNIISLILGIAFLYQTNNLVIGDLVHESKRDLLFSLNKWLVIGGIILTLLNMFVLLISFIYSNRKYFRILDSIDFNMPEDSIKVLNNINILDEFGYLGLKIKRLFTNYLEFSYNKGSKIKAEENKVHFLIEEINKPVILCEMMDKKNRFKIVDLNLEALEALKTTSKSSLLDDIEKIIHPSSLSEFKEFITSITSSDHENRQRFYEKEISFIQSFYDRAVFNVRFYFFEYESYVIEDSSFKVKERFINSILMVLEKNKIIT